MTGATPGPSLPFLSQLAALHITAALVSVRNEALGALWQARAATIDLTRVADGAISGQAVLELQAGAVHATLRAQAELSARGTHVSVVTTPVSPAAVARALPAFAQAAALDAPVRAAMDAELAPDFSLRSARISVQAGAGTLSAGRGSLALGRGECRARGA